MVYRRLRNDTNHNSCRRRTTTARGRACTSRHQPQQARLPQSSHNTSIFNKSPVTPGLFWFTVACGKTPTTTTVTAMRHPERLRLHHIAPQVETASPPRHKTKCAPQITTASPPCYWHNSTTAVAVVLQLAERDRDSTTSFSLIETASPSRYWPNPTTAVAAVLHCNTTATAPDLQAL